jgi:hypothetical protein
MPPLDGRDVTAPQERATPAHESVCLERGGLGRMDRPYFQSLVQPHTTLALSQEVPSCFISASFSRMSMSQLGDAARAATGELCSCTCQDSWTSDQLVPCRIHDDCWSDDCWSEPDCDHGSYVVATDYGSLDRNKM